MAPKEIVSIIGPSGSGKSTLLRCLIQLERANRGTIEIEGHAIARELSDRVVFMDAGYIVEVAPPAKLFTDPDHPRIKTFLERML